MMGGTIWVESESGEGSTFHFTVAAGIVANNDHQKHFVPAEFQGVKILIVDDNAMNRSVLSEMAGERGMQVFTAASAREAIEEIERGNQLCRQFDVIVVDSQMAGPSGLKVAERFRGEPAVLEAMIMMLSSVNQVSDAVMCRQLGISVCLVKPVCDQEFRQGVGKILRRASKEEPTKSVLPLTLETAKELEVPVLLVEDNAVNQMLAVRILEKRGYRVTTAGNGIEALEALKKDSFALVLMDIQMPGMDGLETTATIRAAERGSGAHLPIIAMTAHAMKGDQERCLAAGMDGYVSKPISAKELIEEMKRVLQRDSSEVKEPR
jgi:two-component system sensor histidine kinase/response regulator